MPLSSPSTDLEVETPYKAFRPGHVSACGLLLAVSDTSLRAAGSVRMARVKAMSVFIRLIPHVQVDGDPRAATVPMSSSIFDQPVGQKSRSVKG